MGSSCGRACLQGAILLLMMFAASSFATDAKFRGGVIMSRRLPGYIHDKELTYHVSWRRSSVAGGGCDQSTVDSGTLIYTGENLTRTYFWGYNRTVITNMPYKCTNFSESEDWSYGHFTTTEIYYYTGILGVIGNSWIDPFNSNWNLSTTLYHYLRTDKGVVNSSPRVVPSPVIYLQEGCNHTIKIQASDPDSDTLLCRWGVGLECGGVCSDVTFPGAELDSENCVISYEAVHGSGLKVAAIMIEDFAAFSETPLSSVAYQFVVSVYSSDGPCLRFISPSITHNETCVAIAPDGTMSIDLIVDSGSPDISITEVEIFAPVGVSKSELFQDGGTTFYYRNISWSPEDEDELIVHNFCYSAKNSENVSSERVCLKLFPGVIPPSPILDTASPNGELVDPIDTTWYIKFNNSIERPSITAFITFRELKTGIEVYKINSATSSEVSFISENEILIRPNYDFDEEKEFYINLERGVVAGLEGCRPESDPVLGDIWTFQTLDITPPLVYFDYLYYRYNSNFTNYYCYYYFWYPLISNGNISLHWEHFEDLTWQCSLNTSEQVWVVDCSNGTWNGVNLSEDYYDINVVATDNAGNQVVDDYGGDLHLTIAVDTTAPTVNLTKEYLDERTCLFFFECDEICVFECVFIDHGFNVTKFQHDPYSLNSGVFSTTLMNNHTYSFSVTPIDCVGNIGQPVNYTWTADFEQPTVFGVTNTSILCTEDSSPNTTGQAQAVDDGTGIASLVYTDHNTGCDVVRTWRAVDLAGNIGELVQYITVRSVATLNFLPIISVACDSTDASIDVPTSTATVYNPCGRHLQVTYEDSVAAYSCPIQFNRTWTLTDECSQQSTLYTQKLSLYNLCPSDACGRNETPPRGVCVRGNCFCSVPWYEENCATLILSPLLQQPMDAVLFESEDYTTTLTLLEGTPPFTWSLVSAPYGTTLSLLTRKLTWNNAEAGNHTITVKVTNEVDMDTISWVLSVKLGYTAFLDPIPETLYSMAIPLYLSGYVEYFEGNVVQESHSSMVPVVIEVTNHYYTREIYVYTHPDGTFSGIFYPAPTEYGTYVAGAKHPNSPEPASAQIGWDILGLAVHPQSVALRNSTIEEFQGSFRNVTVLTNDGPHAVHGVSAIALLGATEGLNITIQLTSSNLEVGESSYMSFDVESMGSLHIIFPVKVETEEGVILYISVNLEIAQIHPRLVASPGSINTRIVQGTNRIIELNITNEGSAPATAVTAHVPMSNYLTLMSFGNSNEQMYGGLTLENGDFATLSILATVPPDQPLGEISGQMVVSAVETYLVIQFNFQVSSDVLMNLTVVVEDEYTYFAEGGPLVEGATIRLQNGARQVDMTLTTGEEGTVIFTNILEDRYEIHITGPNHSPVDRIIITSIEEDVYTVFLARRAVRYYFSVAPVTFEETYAVTLEAEFETHVPIPVVTITPHEISLEPYVLGLENTIQFNITNHGLIRANDVRLALPDSHPSLEFSTSTFYIGDLDALTSVIVVVNVTQIDPEGRNVSSETCAEGVSLYYAVNVVFDYECGELQMRSASALLRGYRQDSDCEITTITSSTQALQRRTSRVREYHVIQPQYVFYINPLSAPPDNVTVKICPYDVPTVINCDTCVTNFLKCFDTLPIFEFSNCVHNDLQEDFKDITHILSWIYCLLGLPANIPDAIEYFTMDFFEEKLPKLLRRLNLVSIVASTVNSLACFANAYHDCVLSGDLAGNLSDVRSAVQAMSEAWYPAYETILLSEELLGSRAWIEKVQNPMWVSEAVHPIISDDSDKGYLITQDELSTLLEVPPPLGASVQIVRHLAERLNLTCFNWDNGILEPRDGENMASYSLVSNFSLEIERFNEIFKEKGYTSYIEAYNEAAEIFNAIVDFNEDGLCAVVRLRVEQDVALTREGFLATFAIENKEQFDLSEIQLNIIITDASNGTVSNDLFSIGTETLSGSLTSDSGGWSLPAGTSGKAEWLIAPYTEAAPREDVVYNIGGTLRYTLHNDNISIPLLPTRIIVAPDPHLQVHYFWEKYVIGDNPFTEEKEESVPFALAVVIHNGGYGEASNLRVNSGQPEIIENEKGLLISFKIVSVHLGSETVNPTLAVEFGDLPANTTKVARWWMIASLEGEFRDYSASFEYINPLGDPKLSVLDELEIHELVRNVVIYQENENDNVLDFLVNDVSDPLDYPDALYSSKTFTRYNVSIGNIESIGNVEIQDFNIELQVHTVSNISGWVYFRFTGTQNMFTNTERALNFTKYYNNETIQLPPENAWVTRDRPLHGSEQEQSAFQLHIIDYLQVAGDSIYVLNPCTSDCVSDEQPFEVTLPPVPPINIEVDEVCSTWITILWEQVQMSTVISNQTVIVSSGESRYNITVDGSQSSINLTDLTPATMFSISIVVTADDGRISFPSTTLTVMTSTNTTDCCSCESSTIHYNIMPTSTISQHLLPMSTPVVTVVENDTNAQTSEINTAAIVVIIVGGFVLFILIFSVIVIGVIGIYFLYKKHKHSQVIPLGVEQ